MSSLPPVPPPPLGLIAPFLCARSNLCVHFVWPYGSYVRDKSSPFFSPTHKIKGYLCEAGTVRVGVGIKKEEKKTILILSPVHPSTPDPGEQKGARVALLKSYLWADGVGCGGGGVGGLKRRSQAESLIMPGRGENCQSFFSTVSSGTL